MRVRMGRCLASILIFSLSGLSAARERGPRVEVVCPVPPSAVRLADKQVLAYELHVTNFDMVALTLKRLEVFPDAVTNPPLKVLAEDALPAFIAQVGTMMGGKASTSIEPGERDVLFMWIELPAGMRVPLTLHHRMLFVPASQGNGTAPPDAVLQDFPIPVNQDAPLLLSPPFDGGIWAGAGIANNTDHRRSIFAIDGHIHQPERFAIDWVKVGPNGDARHGTAKNEDWWAYGEPLYAVADGEVTEAVDGIPDNPPRTLPDQVTLDNILGNHVVLKVAPDRYMTYAHLKTGSVVVHAHDQIRRGERIGLLGNSGNSTGAHLHLQLTNGPSPLESEGVPFIFERYRYLGPGEEYPEKQVSVRRVLSLPDNNAVVEFPKKTQ